jgi:hypothetical protein
VVGFRGTYHAVLGRPCYAKFMSVPNYTYLKLKMSGPNGVITVGSTYRHAYECDVEWVEYAEALTESEALIADLECLSKEVPDAKSVPLDPSNCHTRILGVQNPGANIITRCAGTKSHTYDESWHRIECHIFTI